nr:uncharacterized protein LOC129388343 [Dermacentor andersoni]
MVQHSPCTKLIGANQRDACERILELLDGAYRFALTEAKAEPTDVAHSEHAVHTAALSSDTDERAPDEYRQKERMDYVRKRWLANCLTLASEVVLRFDACSENLREGCCANGIVGTPGLWRMLCQRPLNKLGCSLYEDRRCESRLEKDVFVDISNNCQLVTHKLEITYMEAAGITLTAGFWYCTLNGSIDLQPVHVHAMRQATVRVPVRDASMMGNTPKNGLRIFRYSCEQVPPTTGRLCRDCSYNYVRLENLLEQTALLQSVCHAAVTLQAYPEAVCRFPRATTHKECRYDVRSRSLVLLPSPQYIRFQRPPCVAGDCLKFTPKFLRMCLANISELNLTTSHFLFGCDFCFGDGAVLPELSLLALPRCAIIIWEGLLQWLARGYRFRVELGIGNGDVVPCTACKLPPMFTERDFEWQLWETRLWRLGVGETARIMSVTFLLGRLVTDLRFNVGSLASDAASVSCCGPCHPLCANPGLHVNH